MKTGTIPPLRVPAALRKEAEAVLQQGETLSAFMLLPAQRGLPRLFAGRALPTISQASRIEVPIRRASPT